MENPMLDFELEVLESRKIKTNGDFIRSCTNEELVVMYIIMHDKFNPWDKEDLLTWLESEAEEW